ncbi:MAG TPA: hypothetical protein VJR46_10690 [Candidatus Dormibacteraeota bacterium]|nr:hypothetical protein [Candidatus Dormibacteraeota bacterium]
MGQQLFIFGAAFLGSAVESTEALTIVLAVGLTRGWRAPLLGAGAAVVILAVLVLAFGQLIVTTIPDSALKLVVGTLLLLFGLRWLHKAVLRSAGAEALHDEEHAYKQTVTQLSGAAGTDWVGFVLALKGVFLEGLEVVFIVIGVGGTGHGFPAAIAGGVVAALVVAAAGFAVRRPLARVPENTLKYAVGVILTSLGTFWAAEGMGVEWPLDFVSIAGLAVTYFVASRLAVGLIRRRPRGQAVAA